MRTKIPVFVFPGCRMPERKTDWAVGYDVYIRAIVSLEMDKNNPGFRKVISDLSHPRALFPNESVLVGFGVILGMNKNWNAEVRPRGSSVVDGVLIEHAGVPIDPDFLGEFVTSIRNVGKSRLELTRDLRVAQLRFFGSNGSFRPKLERVNSFEKFPAALLRKQKNGNSRGHSSHGSSGTH